MSSAVLYCAMALLVVSVLGPISSANAQSMPSQAQIEQLKSLPRAQQEALAKQFGIDPSMLDSLNSQSFSSSDQNQQQESVIFPRGTRFDDNGDPIIPEDLEEQFTREKDELKPFGYELFAGEPKSFSPTGYAPVPSNYIMGVGDTVKVQLFGKENRSYDLTIDREGKIVVPDLGELNIAGLSYTLMQELIQNQVKQRLIGFNAAVSMGELRSIQVFIAGEAYKPGSYTISSLSTISQALYLAGGFSDIASLRSIRLMRAGEVVSDFDLYDLLLKGDASDDKMLQSGDVVFIPTRGDMVTVKGEVKRPALYELKGDETLEDAIRFAGGSEDSAYLSSAQLQRIVKGKRLISTVDLTSEKHLNKELQGGDVLTLRKVSDSLENSLLLVGAVTRPGHYEWYEGIRLNDVLRDPRHDLLEQADLAYGLVVRETGPQRDLSLYQFNVAEAVSGKTEENLILQERDQIVIFSRYQTKEQEEQQLSRFTLTEQERQADERQKMLAEYREAFLQDLVQSKKSSEEDERKRLLEQEQQRTPLTDLFGSPDKDDVDIADEELALYSRDKLLEPIMQRIENQRTSNGNTPLVYVAGEVNHPGVYPLVENASVSRLLDAAGGVKDSAYLKRAEVTRFAFNKDTAQTDYLSVALNDVLNGEMDVPLQGRDRLNVLSIPEWQNTYEVTLKGEVRFPGTYAIKRGETLTQLIERAGGFTDHAFIEGAVFTREDLRQQEQERKKILAQELQREVAGNMLTGTGDSRVSYSEVRNLLADLLSAEPIGRLIMDLPKLLAGNGANNVQLKDGDTLHVPSRKDSISIMGEVQMATSYRFDPELTVDEYISRSGGTKEKADEDRIYIVKANGAIERYEGGSSWFSFSNNSQLGPGDTIIVPMDTTYTENLELWSQVTGIIYNSAVAIAAINGL
ncbi:SLBB domain-containing protein [Idiomarina abyssalis]|uniref:SLBB domain-containing protein n=1 Tax=Idiomarina abyssalis TaxID=86102 RepID=UPI002300AFC9|nr:SLBB domain-containing protein [Idiomarina abyssalis]MDA6067168.1 SLBB domain-containing protein [Idiomarina abyssalis]